MYWNLSDEYVKMPTRWLTLTWEVLKFYKSDRCTEIEYTININMRCIEIPMQTTGKMAQQRLTLTWDVLKLF